MKGYYEQLVQSDWLTTVGADYGVGLGHVTGSLVLDGGPSGGPAAVSDSDIIALLTQLILDGGIPAPTANSIYVVAYPETTVITSSFGNGTSCYSFGGYHGSFPFDAGYVAYAVIPTCTAPTGSLNTSEDLLDEALSHEFIEAATDPYTLPTGAGYLISGGADPWTYSLSEVGDLCAYTPLFHEPDGGLIAQRIWSNSAAALGTGSPCVPAPTGEAYFNVSVNPDTTVLVDAGFSGDLTVTFTVTGWSTAATSDWAVWAQPSLIGSINPALLNPQLNGSSYPVNINNGQTATLTLTVPAGTSAGNYAGVTLYSYTSPNQIDVFGSYSAAAVFVQ